MTAIEEYAPPGPPPGYRVLPELVRHLSRLCPLHQSFRSQSMIEGITLQDKSLISEMTAKALLEVEAVHFREDKPFIFTSGWASPVYIDCRKLISYPR